MNFFIKTFLKHQLKNLPQDQVDMIISIIEKNPELFKKIADEIQAKVSAGADQQEAAMEVVKKYQNEIAAAMK